MTREAELELEIASLREVLDVANEWFDEYAPQELLFAVSEALSTPPSTTALQSLIENVERRTIERCADLIERGTGDWLLGKKQATAIRALPTGNLKLEDL